MIGYVLYIISIYNCRYKVSILPHIIQDTLPKSYITISVSFRPQQLKQKII